VKKTFFVMILSLPQIMFAQQNAAENFNSRLGRIYDQNPSTTTDQVVQVSMDALVGVSLLNFITPQDQSSASKLSKELFYVNSARTAEDIQLEIESLQMDPHNYDQVLRDDAMVGYRTVHLQLKPDIEARVLSIKRNAIKFNSNPDISEYAKEQLRLSTSEALQDLTLNKYNYLDSRGHALGDCKVISSKLSPFVTRKIANLKQQEALAMSAEFKRLRTAELSNEIKSIARRSIKARTMNVLVRGSQVLLAVDIGTRFYILSNLENDTNFDLATQKN
jgi:hypothetical protein